MWLPVCGWMSTCAEDREFAMWRVYRSIDIAKELFTVHLNDQDKSFGVENLRSAFNQVKLWKRKLPGMITSMPIS